MNFSKQTMHSTRNRGVTLIELLVVISILSVLTAIMIPRLRVINKDRNIREAGRIVGSMLSKASSRAINEGVAGVIIEPNPNFTVPHGPLGNVNYAGMRMYVMRRVPPFTGDDLGSLATIGDGSSPGFPEPTSTEMTIAIPFPLEHTPTKPLVQAQDQVRLNHNSVLYRVLSVNTTAVPGSLVLELALGLKPGFGAIRPVLTPGATVPYVVYRQPRKLESSRVDLPTGYYIDLRYSGPLVPTPATPPVSPDWERGSAFDRIGAGAVQLFFTGDGAVDRYAVTDAAGFILDTDIARDAFHFFVTGYEPNATSPVLQNPAAMWVTLDKSTGGVNVAYNAIADPTAPLFNQVKFARSFAETRRSANQ